MWKIQKDFVDNLKGLIIKEDEMFIYNIVSLCTKTSIKETLHVIKTRLEDDVSLQGIRNQSVQDSISLLQFVNLFRHQGDT